MTRRCRMDHHIVSQVFLLVVVWWWVSFVYSFVEDAAISGIGNGGKHRMRCQVRPLKQQSGWKRPLARIGGTLFALVTRLLWWLVASSSSSFFFFFFVVVVGVWGGWWSCAIGHVLGVSVCGGREGRPAFGKKRVTKGIHSLFGPFINQAEIHPVHFFFFFFCCCCCCGVSWGRSVRPILFVRVVGGGGGGGTEGGGPLRTLESEVRLLQHTLILLYGQ